MVPASIDRVWRLFGTGFAFASFGLGGLALTVTAFPVIALLSRDEARRIARTRALIGASFRLFVWMLRRLGVIELEVDQLQQLQALRGTIVVANHPSLLDVVLLISLIPNAQCVVKHQLSTNRFLRGVVRWAGYIRNDVAPDAFMAACAASLAAGDNLVIFPEGTRTTPGRPIRLQRGFANIAEASRADIQVVRITCTPTTLTKGEQWYEIPRRRVRFRLFVEHRVRFGDYPDGLSRALRVRRLTRDVETFFGGLEMAT